MLSDWMGGKEGLQVTRKVLPDIHSWNCLLVGPYCWWLLGQMLGCLGTFLPVCQSFWWWWGMGPEGSVQLQVGWQSSHPRKIQCGHQPSAGWLTGTFAENCVQLLWSWPMWAWWQTGQGWHWCCVDRFWAIFHSKDRGPLSIISSQCRMWWALVSLSLLVVGG